MIYQRYIFSMMENSYKGSSTYGGIGAQTKVLLTQRYLIKTTCKH